MDQKQKPSPSTQVIGILLKQLHYLDKMLMILMKVNRTGRRLSFRNYSMSLLVWQK